MSQNPFRLRTPIPTNITIIDGLFAPANAKFRVLLNSGLAALAWLALEAFVTMLTRRFALPGPRRPLRYVARRAQ